MDPMADSYPNWSPYVYVLNNPIRFNDPSGMCPEEDRSSGNCAGVADNFLRNIRSTLSGMEMSFQFGALLAASQAAGEITGEVKEAATEAAGDIVSVTGEGFDLVSDLSNVAAIVGLVATPFTKGGSLLLTSKALSVGLAADATSLGAKTLDYAAFGGSGEAVVDQAVTTGLRAVLGGGAQASASRLVTRTGSVTGATYRSTQTGRFVPNSYGNTVTAVSDATRVGINIVVPSQGYYSTIKK